MAEADWTPLSDGLDSSSVHRGATSGIAPPSGGGSFIYGFNSVVATAGAAGLYTNQASYAPMAKGGQITAAMKRGVSGGPLNFAPLLFLCLGSNSVNGSGYLLGLEDADPHRIVLRKGAIIEGIPEAAIGQLGILAQGADTHLNDTWLHLRLDAIVNANGDVILKAWQSDIGVHGVGSPVWTPVPGCESFTDDALGVNSGSLPFTSGYAGFAFQTKDVTRRAFFDELTVARQL